MPQGSPNKVLVVAGADFHLASLEPALAGRYELRHVDSGDAALETLREFAADVVLLDMIAPDLDAWATCRRITSGRRHQGPKVLLVADQDRAVDRGRGREVGACDFVTRAIDQDDLRARIELLLELKKAQDDSMAKSEFVANISHEIRTPMTAILGYSENLRDATLSEPARSQALDTIWRNGQHLLDLINNILDISKIEAQKLQVERVECCPAEILAEVAAMMRARAESSGLTLTVALDGAIPVTLLSDRTRIKQILVNLVGNAIKFTHRGGVRIVARFLDTGAQPLLEIDVIDTGIGIDEQTIPLLGQPFVQAEAGLARRHGGTGLGLSISRRLARLLGGDLMIHSAKGRGSTFTLRIAAGRVEGAAMQHEIAQQLGAAAQRSPAPMPRIPYRILLAEDGPDNQRLLSFVLQRAGAEVTLAQNGRIAVDSAVAAAQTERPFDVILMDMQMPVLDGYEATALLRRSGYAGPIVAVTAHAMVEDRERCMQAGCDRFTTKPVDREALIRIIHEVLEQPR